MRIAWLRKSLFSGFAGVCALTACVDESPAPQTGDGDGDGDAATSTSEGEPEGDTYTWYRDVQTVMANKCGTCHVAGEVAPFALSTYEDVQAVAPLLPESIAAGTMPPWPPTDACNTYSHSRALDEAQREMLLTWFEQDMPLGDPADAPPPSEPVPLWQPDVVIEMPEDYTPSKAPDDYHCFLIDGPELDSTEYVTSFEVYPGERSIVHHVIAYLVLPNMVEQFETFDAAEEGPGYTCFGAPTGAGGGSSVFTGIRWIGSWAPGGGHWDAPEGTGMAVPPGSKMVIQMHYNAPPDSTLSDRSSVALGLSPSVERPAIKLPFTKLGWFSGNMPIPAGEPSVIHVHDADRNDQLLQLLLAQIGAGPGDTVQLRDASLHMHTLGRQGQMKVKHASGEESCLLHIDDWDFGWQDAYTLEEAVELGPDDILQLACEWDNSAENQPLVDGVPREPTPVNWGDGTFDEMCLGILYAYK